MLDEEHGGEWPSIIEKNYKILGDRYRLPEGMFFVEDFPEYRGIINEVPDGGTICELGVWQGRSLCLVADLIKRKNLRVVAVDSFAGALNEPQQMALAQQHNIEQLFRDNMNRFGLSPLVYRTITDVAAALVEDGSLDCCFIDAAHDYDSVKNDLINWEPKVKRGGIICGHDYGGSWVGVQKAVDERYREVRHHPPSGVWSRKIV